MFIPRTLDSEPAYVRKNHHVNIPTLDSPEALRKKFGKFWRGVFFGLTVPPLPALHATERVTGALSDISRFHVPRKPYHPT